MKRKNLKLRAFTIMEVVIAMLVTAILFGFTYEAYSIIEGSYQGFRRKNEDLASAVQLDQWLSRDFTRGNVIKQDAEGRILFNSDSLQIAYKFGPDFVCRTVHDITDTIKVGTSGIQATYEGKITNNDTDEQSTSVIDELQLTIHCPQASLPAHYRKTYSSADLIIFDTHAAN